MKKLRIMVPVAIGIVLVAFLSLNIALAQEDGEKKTSPDKFVSKVAEILGLDAAEVDDAIKQARADLRKEAVQGKLEGLVKKGELSQEQADEYFQWTQSKPMDIPAIGKTFLKKKGRHWGRPGHGRFHKSWKKPHMGIGKSHGYEELLKELQTAVAAGKITEKEADEKLKALNDMKEKKAGTKEPS